MPTFISDYLIVFFSC